MQNESSDETQKAASVSSSVCDEYNREIYCEMNVRYQGGYSLIEIMIAMTLAVGSLAAVSSLVGYGVGVNGNLLNSARLNEELGNVYALIIADLRRTGFSGNTKAMVSQPDANPSPFNQSISISEYPGETAQSCVLFSYDSNDNGTLDLASPNENFGYRLLDGTVEIRRNSLDCTSNGWEDLTDSSVVKVTSLRFAVNQTVQQGITSTSVTVFLSGELSANDKLSKVYQTVVVVRNHES